MIRKAPPLHPDSSKWYWLEWSEKELQGATIDVATWTLPPGITEDASAVTGRRVGIKVSGATLGQDYEAKLQIQTSGGETLHEYLIIRCRNTGH